MSHLYKQYNSGKSVLYAWFPAMHTRVDLILCDKEEPELLNIAAKIQEECRRLEKIGSFYDEESELYRMNQTASQIPVIISNELCGMIEMCRDYHQKTQGCFDITVQSDTYDRYTFSEVVFSSGTSTIYYMREGIRTDLSGFLKGYALEKVRNILSIYGVENALLNMGNSSVMALGDHPYGDGWKVAFAAGTDSQLHNQCLSTSGNDTAERRHIVAPQTGEWVTRTGSIAVVTENAAEGEILSTALFAATPEQRKEILRLPAIKEIYDIKF